MIWGLVGLSSSVSSKNATVLSAARVKALPFRYLKKEQLKAVLDYTEDDSHTGEHADAHRIR